MSTWDGVPDRVVWQAARDDPEAFGELFARHARPVRSYCARLTADLEAADDLTSVVFLQAWARRHDVELERDSALPWLLGIALHVCRNARRSLRRHRAALARMARDDVAPDHADHVADRLTVEQRLAAASSAVSALPRPERDVVTLVLWGGLSYEDAAAALGVPVGTVRSRLSRARARLRHQLASPGLQLQD